MREIALPDFIGESEKGMIVMVSALEDELEPLFRRFHRGEKVPYWFDWELIEMENRRYLVALDLNWEGGQGVAIGFTAEMWEVLPTVREKEQLTVITDWSLVGETRNQSWRALVIPDAHRGLDLLVRQVAQVDLPLQGTRPRRELDRLQEILAGCVDPAALN
ncbi:MAG: hypothetical protein IMW93_04760 [Thermoanaerobacteraceae bacterium]|nr:hypothetical protein [Thermoanaerobacteraceae bacterium]